MRTLWTAGLLFVGCAPAPLPRCLPGPGATGSPSTIDEAVALIDSLPRPVSVACVVEALDRPLSVVATSSVVSLQPAAGPDAPRLFLLGERLILSVVPDGDGAELLELAEFVDDRNTIKAEIAFPVTEAVDPALPHTRILFDGGGTTCGLCHSPERAEVGADGITRHISPALKPFSYQDVPVADVAALAAACGPDDPVPCPILRAVFAHGPVAQGAFPDAVGTLE